MTSAATVSGRNKRSLVHRGDVALQFFSIQVDDTLPMDFLSQVVLRAFAYVECKQGFVPTHPSQELTDQGDDESNSEPICGPRKHRAKPAVTRFLAIFS